MVKTNTASLYPDRLQRWRRAAVMLSASRRFRYTLDLKKGEEKKRIKAKIRMHAQVIRAVYLFQVAGAQVNGNTKLPLTPTPTRDNDIQPEQLAPVTWDHHFSAVQHCGGVKGLVKNLKTNPEKRLPGDEVDLLQRKSVFGSNTYPREKGQSFWRFFLEACRDTTLIILMIVTAACLGLPIKTRGIDGGSIALAVVIVIVVTALSNYRQYLQFRSLNKEKQNIHLEVSGALASKPVRPQDVVTTEAAEIIVLEQTQKGGPFAVMQSTAAVNKTHCVFSHDQVTNIARDQDVTGSETEVAGQRIITEAIGGEVISVGINTEWRLLTTNIAKDNGEESLLQVRLHGIATLIGIFGLVVAFAALVVLLVRYFTGHTNHPNGSLQFAAGKTSVGDVIDGAMEIFTVAVIVVVAVPEGLSLAVSLIIAYSMRKMLADKALVRGLSACDAMGSVTIICDDKSRTLTLNLMTVVEAYVCGKKIDSPNNRSLLPPKVTSLLIEGIAQNTTGSVFIPEGGGDVIFSGSPTEKAVLQWGINLGMNFDAVRSDSSVICAFPFNSENMRGGVAVKLSDSEVHIHWKGAAEIVLALCTRYIDANGCLLPMDEDKVTLFKKAIDEMAAGGLRCVAIAYRSCEMENVPTDEEELVHWELPVDDLVLLAIVGLKDPCQPGVKDAVQSCISAGIKVCMVTGDDLQTARAIALECGILGSDADATEPNLIDGREFRALSDMQRQEIAEKISVLGSSSPSDELLLAQALRKRGHVVAVTRDGTNDAPALHEGDIGLAMGIEGEAVANDNSDIVIIDGNFSSIVKVVRWGRSVYANIQKFIQFQLTINVAALIINVVAAVSSGDAPLNAVQLLWVNFIMDTLGALALATEPPTNHLMHRPPAGRREPLITNIKWRNLVIQALYQVTVLLVLNFRGRSILNLEHKNNYDAINEKNTLLFNAFFLCQIFNVFNARKPDEINVFKGVTRNHLFMAIVGLTLVLQIFIIMFLGKLTSTVRLSWKSWLVSIIIGLISGPLAIIGKLIPVPETPLSELLTKKLHQWRTSRGSISRRHVAAWVMSI